MSSNPDAPLSPAARRQRRRRWRQRNKLICIEILLAPDAVGDLVRLDWLRTADRGDKDAVAGAVIGITAQAIKRGVTP